MGTTSSPPKSFNSILDVTSFFSDKESCKEYLEKIRWQGDIVCPHCGHDGKIYKMKNFTYKCSECRKPFSVTKGTIFENSPIPLRKWFLAIWLETSHKKGISSLQLSKDIDVTQKTAWFMLQRIRHAMQTESFAEQLSGDVEADETMVGGKESNKHKSKRTKGTQGRSTKTKTPVLGMLQRGGRVTAKTVKDVSSNTIKQFAKETLKPGSNLYTDEWGGYSGLSGDYKHERVNHSALKYVIGMAHTNTIEGFWSLLKRGIMGVYHSVSTKHLDLYVTAAEFRYNNRKSTESDRFQYFVNLAGSSRLKYIDLTESIEDDSDNSK